MSEAPCKLLKLDATGLPFLSEQNEVENIAPFTVSLHFEERQRDFVLRGFLKGPKMGRKVPKWAESLLVPCWASPN